MPVISLTTYTETFLGLLLIIQFLIVKGPNTDNHTQIQHISQIKSVWDFKTWEKGHKHSVGAALVAALKRKGEVFCLGVSEDVSQKYVGGF